MGPCSVPLQLCPWLSLPFDLHIKLRCQLFCGYLGLPSCHPTSPHALTPVYPNTSGCTHTLPVAPTLAPTLAPTCLLFQLRGGGGRPRGSADRHRDHAPCGARQRADHAEAVRHVCRHRGAPAAVRDRQRKIDFACTSRPCGLKTRWVGPIRFTVEQGGGGKTDMFGGT